MPLPTRRSGEDRGKFVSRCISEMSKKDKNRSKEQIIAMCNSKAAFEVEELAAIAELYTNAVKQITNLNPPLKKKKKDKFRITKEDGSGTDDTAAAKVIRTSYVKGHTHTIPEGYDSGETSFVHGHSHSFKQTNTGGYEIKEVNGHVHFA